MEQKATQLKKLAQELENISVEKQEEWINLKPWIAKATPFIVKNFSDLYDDFQKVCKPPVFKPPRHNSFSMDTITGQTYGDPVTYFHTENAQIAATSKKEIISFVQGIFYSFETAKTKKTNIKNTKKVFIVHGQDDLAKEQTARFLEKIELEAVILHEQSSGGRTIIEKLEYYTDVAFAIVLLTPDDVGALAVEKENLKPRARQNVIFELGYLIGKLNRKNVCALLKDNVEKPTNYDGVVYIQMDNNSAWKQKIVSELIAAKIDGNFIANEI